ncbi:MAG: tetratricopeptide repeat protein, partial [Verrucomicrobiota bacterium]
PLDPVSLLSAAKQAFRSGQLSQAEHLLATMSSETLPADVHPEYQLLQFRLALQRTPAPLDVLHHLTRLPEMPRSALENFLLATLETLPPSALQRVSDLTASEVQWQRPLPWLLASRIEEQSGNAAEAIRFGQHYLQSRPDDLMSLSRLAKLACEQAAQSHPENPEEIQLAESWTKHLIQAQPYAPDPMRLLMRLYRKTDQSEKLTSVPALVGQSTSNPQILAQCAYLLATEGLPELALPYYERALASSPNDLRIRMNLASCWTRLERWDEAVQFYRHTIETGLRGKPYHLHECLLRLWRIADDQSNQSDCLAYFHQLADRHDLPWRPLIAEELISLFLQVGLTENAHQLFLKELRGRNTEGEIAGLTTSCQLLIRHLSQQKDWSTATSILSSFANQLTVDQPAYLRAQQDLALLQAEAGDLAEALESLESQGSDALYLAARLAEGKANDREKAQALYERFLASGSTNLTLRKRAGKALLTWDE